MNHADNITSKEVFKALNYVLKGHKSAVVFSKDLKSKVRVTRKQYYQPTPNTRDITVTISGPNFKERLFLLKCKQRKIKQHVWIQTK